MKRLFLVVMSLFLCVCLSSCKSEHTDYVSGYDERYLAGYEEGKWDGAYEFRKYMANEIWARYQDVEGQTSRERGLHPEDAIIVLKDYLEGKSVSDEEMRTAIRSIAYFYTYAWDVINEIEEIDIEFRD